MSRWDLQALDALSDLERAFDHAIEALNRSETMADTVPLYTQMRGRVLLDKYGNIYKSANNSDDKGEQQ